MNKKLISLSIISIFLLTSLIIVSVPKTHATEIIGNTIYVDDDKEADYTKIQDAIDNASVRDTIFVYNGTYYENVVINKSVKLIGEDKEFTIIDGSKKPLNVIIIITDGVTVSNFTIQNSTYWEFIEAGVGIKASDTTIENNIFRNNWHGIYINPYSKKECSNNKITRNFFINQNIVIYRAYNQVIHNNNFYNEYRFDEDGISLYGSNCNIISMNDFYGRFNNNLKLQDSHNNTIKQNSFVSGLYGLYLDRSNNNRVCYNNFIYCLRNAAFSLSIKNKWDHNYWGRPRFLPKIIFGTPLFNIDWRPLLIPGPYFPKTMNTIL